MQSVIIHVVISVWNGIKQIHFSNEYLIIAFGYTNKRWQFAFRQKCTHDFHLEFHFGLLSLRAKRKRLKILYLFSLSIASQLRLANKDKGKSLILFERYTRDRFRSADSHFIETISNLLTRLMLIYVFVWKFTRVRRKKKRRKIKLFWCTRSRMTASILIDCEIRSTLESNWFVFSWPESLLASISLVHRNSNQKSNIR